MKTPLLVSQIDMLLRQALATHYRVSRDPENDEVVTVEDPEGNLHTISVQYYSAEQRRQLGTIPPPPPRPDRKYDPHMKTF